MRIKEIMYGTTCDGCEELFEDYNGIAFYATNREANEEVTQSPIGWIQHEDKHYCPKCHVVDANDNVVIRKHQS